MIVIGLRLNVPSFNFRAPVTEIGPFLYDQDFVHNFKKLINVLVSTVRNITLGEHLLNLDILGIVYTSFPPSRHGLQEKDLERKGYAAMDFPSALRLCSGKMLACVQELIDGSPGQEAHPYLKGLWYYLKMCRRYVSMFMS